MSTYSIPPTELSSIYQFAIQLGKDSGAILLRALEGSGHGMGRPLAAEIEESSDQTAFLLHELGAAISR